MRRPMFLALAASAGLLCVGAAQAGGYWAVNINTPEVGAVISNRGIAAQIGTFRSMLQSTRQQRAARRINRHLAQIKNRDGNARAAGCKKTHFRYRHVRGQQYIQRRIHSLRQQRKPLLIGTHAV